MEVTSRIRSILHILLQAEGAVTDQEIADQLHISKRTVLRETDEIARLLEKYGLTFVRKKGEGSRIEGTSEQKQELSRALSRETGLTVTDMERRRSLLKLELLKNAEPQKLFYYSDLFGVSEATISNDLEALMPWAEE